MGYVVLSVAIFLAVLLVTSLTLNSLGFFDSAKKEESDVSEEDSSAQKFTPDPVGSYDEVFSQYGIVYSPTVFPEMESASYAAVDKRFGWIDCLDFGYQGNLVLNLTETRYYLLDGYTDMDKQVLYYQMLENYEELNPLSFCSVTYDTEDQYYMIQYAFTDLDQPENYEKMIELGIVEKGSLAISMKLADESLLSEGYQKKQATF